MKWWYGLLFLSLLSACVQSNYVDGEAVSQALRSSQGCVPSSIEFLDCHSEIPNAAKAVRKKMCFQDGSDYILYDCEVLSCQSGFVLENNSCRSNVGKICSPGVLKKVNCYTQIAHANTAWRVDQCNEVGDNYIIGSCKLESCLSGYVVAGNSCQILVQPTPTPVPTTAPTPTPVPTTAPTPTPMPTSPPTTTLNFVADHTVAKESILRAIPNYYIDKAREELVIAYQHTSHGTHVSRGMFGLQDYKSGDDILFAVSTKKESGKLDFRDYALSIYADSGVDASDLSRNETAFIQTTRNFLDHPYNKDVNVVMWSWCDISNHKVAANYLSGIQTLVDEYGPGGSKSRASSNSVTFILMTGHATAGNNEGNGRPANQAKLITDYCRSHHLYCLDYYAIDTHDMNDYYWEDAGDNGNSSRYEGNFYLDYQDSHKEGTHWFYNKSSPGGSTSFGAHNTQHITANRKAYAMWYILARIAGWNGELE